MSRPSAAGGRSKLLGFVAANRVIARRFEEKQLLALTADLQQLYPLTVAQICGSRDKVVDFGAGKSTPFAQLIDPNLSVELIGIDIDATELAANNDVTHKLAIDVATYGFPSVAKDADVVCSSMVLEHLADVEAITKRVFDTLKPGGTTVHVFSGRYAPFAIGNRLLPEPIANALLRRIFPRTNSLVGFTAYYDRTDPKSIERVFSDCGFKKIDLKISYRFSPYFGFFFPAYLLARLVEVALQAVGFQQFACYILLTATKPKDAG